MPSACEQRSWPQPAQPALPKVVICHGQKLRRVRPKLSVSHPAWRFPTFQLESDIPGRSTSCTNRSCVRPSRRATTRPPPWLSQHPPSWDCRPAMQPQHNQAGLPPTRNDGVVGGHAVPAFMCATGRSPQSSRLPPAAQSPPAPTLTGEVRSRSTALFIAVAPSGKPGELITLLRSMAHLRAAHRSLCLQTPVSTSAVPPC